MKLKFVAKENIRVSKKSSSKFSPLIDALKALEPGGEVLEVTYANVKELNSMRNVVYTFNRESGLKIKSGRNNMTGKIFFFREKA